MLFRRLLRHRTQRWISWLLLIGFLHGVLAPGVGTATNKDDAARTMLFQLCGANGPQFVEVDLHGADADSDTSRAPEHSGFCVLCAYPATPAQADIAALQPAAPFCIPVSAPDAPEPRFATAWSPVHARAPPTGV